MHTFTRLPLDSANLLADCVSYYAEFIDPNGEAIDHLYTDSISEAADWCTDKMRQSGDPQYMTSLQSVTRTHKMISVSSIVYEQLEEEVHERAGVPI